MSMTVRKTTAVLVAAAVCWLAAVFARPAVGGEGTLIQLPTFGPNKSGLKLELDTTWVAAPGYRPVHLEVKTADGLPSPRERRLVVEIAPWSNWGARERTSGEIVLPKGAASATGHLLAMQSREWYSTSVATFEGGYPLKDLSVQHVSVANRTSGFQLGKPKMLIIDSKSPTLRGRDLVKSFRGQGQGGSSETYELPDFRGLHKWQPAQGFSTSGTRPLTDANLLDMLPNVENLEMLPPEQLPDEWIAYSSLDIVFISRSDLFDIRRSRRSTLCEALKQWTAAGGNLVVYDMGDDYGELLRLEAALGLAGISAREAPLTRWKGPDESDRTFEQLQRVVDQEWALTSSRLADHPDTNLRKSADELSTLQAERRTATLGDPEWLPMRTLEYGHGKVIAMPDENPFPGSDAKWQWLEQVIKPNDDWNARVGVDLQTGDLQFLNYLIPDVGLPPVNSFRLLITLFVIVIGPVNYLLLKRRKRLFLLLVTVPLGAAIVTGGLFSYALIKDGLRVRTRVHSFTYADQRAGLASSWSRHTYFASLPPSQGLTFAEQAAVFPVSGDQQNQRYYQTSRKLMKWEGDRQRFTSGYLSSRTAAQFVVANSEPLGETRLVFQSRGPGKPPQVTNRLGVSVHKLLVIADDGNAYWAENIKSDDQATPQAVELSTALATFQALDKRNQPVDPFVEQRISFFGNRSRWNVVDYAPQGIMGLGRFRAMYFDSSGRQALEPGEFLAVTSRSPYVPLGTAGVEEEASFHMIRGRYLPE